MPFVNYVKEHNAFIEYAADNGLRPNEILVWESLFHIMNQRANGNYWPDGFIRVKNDRLLTYAPIGFDSLSRARNALAQRGLISYKPGKKNADIPMYELHYLTAVSNPQPQGDIVDNPVDNSLYTGFYPQFADNMGYNMGGNIRDNIRGNMGGNIGYQYINLNNKPKETETYIDDDEDDGDGFTRGRARAYERLHVVENENDEYAAADKALAAVAAQAIKQDFGRDATPAETRSLAVCARLCGFGSDMLSKAIGTAARMGARVPGSYVRKILSEWRDEDVLTPEEADEYQVMKDALDGRNEFGSGDTYEDVKRMSEARKERRERHEAAKGGGEGGSHSASGI